MQLEVNNLRAVLGKTEVLKDASMRVGAGEFIGLIGPNGAGKTTLLRAILGFVPSQGTILFDGQNAHRMSSRQKARHVAYLPQDRDVAWPVSVEMVVSLARTTSRPPFVGLDHTDQLIVEEAMRRMDVLRFRVRPATELSGGERARVLIARMLAQATPLLLADEPIAGLDPSHQLTLMQSFAALASEGKTVIASLHDLSLAAQSCTRLILMDEGQIVADGTPTEVLTVERLRQVYGVEATITHIDEQLIVHPRAVIAKELS